MYFFDDMFKMHFYYADTEKKFNKICKHFGQKIVLSNCNGRHIALDVSNGQIVSIIFARDNRQEILAHEAVHAGLHLMETIGQKLKDDEILSYIVEFIVKQCNGTLKQGKRS